MFVPTLAVRPEPSSLLTYLACEFAPAIARLWPAPHAPFLTAPAPRRHLACLALSLGQDLGDDRELLIGGRLRSAIARVLGDPPQGLDRALGRMGEIAWPADDYRKLLRLLSDVRAGKVLRHAASLDAALVRRLAGLPGPMANATGLTIEMTEAGVMLVGEAYEALRFRDGPASADAAAGRWANAASVKALFEGVREDLVREVASPPHPGTARLRPLASKAALRDAARRYRNCLAEQSHGAATGLSAYYEWVEPPGAVVEICRDHVFGWRLNQARLQQNAALPEPLQVAVKDDLALMGVHVGRAGWELEHALTPEAGFRYPVRTAIDAAQDAFVVE